jgi:hypothetical protein
MRSCLSLRRPQGSGRYRSYDRLAPEIGRTLKWAIWLRKVQVKDAALDWILQKPREDPEQNFPWNRVVRIRGRIEAAVKIRAGPRRILF